MSVHGSGLLYFISHTEAKNEIDIGMILEKRIARYSIAGAYPM